MLTVADVEDALRACFDPETGRDVVESGVVTRLTLEADREAPGAGIAGVTPRQRLRVALRGKEDEDWRALLTAQLRNRLAGIEGLSQVEIAWEARLFRILG